MAAIRISDGLSTEILTANPQATSGFAKSLKGTAAQLLAGTDFAGQLRTDLLRVNPGDSGFRLSWKDDVPVGPTASATSLTVSAGTSALVSVFNRTGMLLLDDPVDAAPSKVRPGQAVVALTFHPTLAVALGQKAGQLSFGVDASVDAQWRFFQPFDIVAATPTLGEACKAIFETSVFPNTAMDLKAMALQPVGTIASISGQGHLRVGVTVDVVSAINPLASLDTLGKLGKLQVSGGVSASVGVEAAVSGEFEVRVQTLPSGKVRLSVHKASAGELGISLDAAAGAGLTIGKRDLLAMLFGRPADAPGPTKEALVAAGISQKQLDRIVEALEAGMSKRVELALHAAFSSVKVNEAAFCYDIDVAALDATGSAAVDNALAGNLRDLTRLEPELPGHGVTVVRSRTEQLRRRKVAWRLNAVGLVNVLSMTELAKKATVVHDEESGEVLITDEVTSQKVGAVATPKEVRRLLFQTLMLTATYKAGGLDQNSGVTAAQSFFKMDRDVNRHEMSDLLDAVSAVGLLPPDEIEGRLNEVDDFGRGSLLLDVEYDNDACVRMFLGTDGQARSASFYEKVGRDALALLVQARDADAYRRLPLVDDVLWARMRDAGAANLRTVLPPPITSGSDDVQTLKVAVVAADLTMIVWWAAAMASASKHLAEMRAFLAGPPPVAPDDRNAAFADRRRKVSKAMVDVVQKSPSSFGGDPWGLVALFQASARTGQVTAAVVSSRLTLFLPE